MTAESVHHSTAKPLYALKLSQIVFDGFEDSHKLQHGVWISGLSREKSVRRSKVLLSLGRSAMWRPERVPLSQSVKFHDWREE